MAFVNPFRSTLTNAEILNAADTACAANTWTEIGRCTVSAGAGIALGYDNFGGMANATGRSFIDLKTGVGVNFNGKIRIDLETPQKRVERTLFETTTGRARIGAADPSIREPLPMIPDVAGEDWHFVLRAFGTVAQTVDVSECVIEIDATQYDDL